MSQLPPEVDIETQLEEESQLEAPFLLQVGTAFIYPLTGAGVFILVGGTLLLVFGVMASIWPIIGLLANIGVMGFLAAYLMRIITESGEGEDTPPSWPDVTDLHEDILRPLWLFVVPAVLVFIPYLWVSLGGSDPSLEPETQLQWALLALALALLPMMLLSVSMHNSLAGLSPAVLLPSYVKAAGSYVLALGVLAMAVWLEYTLRSLLFDVNIWLGLVVSQSVYLYTLMVEARVLGLLYRTNRDRLNWQV